MSKLFTPVQFRDIVLRNRLVVSPMCQYSATDGFANDWHLVHLGSRAVGGAGLVMVEATAVAPEGRISPGDLGLWKDDHISFLKRITQFIEQQGAIAGIQLAHAGRKASTRAPWLGGAYISPADGGWVPLAPSPLPYSDKYGTPLQMTDTDINNFITDFGSAVRRALEAGLKVIEIHAAHGYLINSFLSPLTNQRTDHWGGSFDNRIRLLLQLVETARANWPAAYPLFVRISGTDWIEGGWTVADSVLLAEILKNQGVDLMDCSSGGMVPNAKIITGPGYQVPVAQAVRQTGMPTGAVGMITTVEQAEDILTNQQADLIFMARHLLRDPYFALHAANKLDEDIEWPVQYARAK